MAAEEIDEFPESILPFLGFGRPAEKDGGQLQAEIGGSGECQEQSFGPFQDHLAFQIR